MIALAQLPDVLVTIAMLAVLGLVWVLAMRSPR